VVIRSGNHGFACYVKGSSFLIDAPGVASGYTDGTCDFHQANPLEVLN